MATETQPAATGSAAPTTPAEPAKVDPRAAALAMFENANTHKEAGAFAPGPKASAPAGAATGTQPAGHAETGTPPGSSDPSTTPPSGESSEQKPAGEQKDRLSAGYARLARKEAALLEQRKQLETERAEYLAWKAAADKVKADPAAILELHGKTLEEVAAAYLAREAGQPQPSPEERIAALEREKADRAKLEDDARKKADDEAKAAQAKQIHAAGVQVVVDVLDATTFPTIVALGEHEQAFDALKNYVALHKIPRDQVTTDLLKQVAAGVEQALADDIGGVIEKVPHIAKRAPTPSTEKPANGQPTASGAQGTGSTSLASAEVSGAPAPQPGRRYTREELRAMAMAHFAAPSN